MSGAFVAEAPLPDEHPAAKTTTTNVATTLVVHRTRVLMLTPRRSPRRQAKPISTSTSISHTTKRLPLTTLSVQ